MQQQSSVKLTGYLLAPHEWLRTWAYKLIGKSYRYHLGDQRVVSAEELTVGQKLFCLLMPLGVGLFAVFAVAMIWGISAAWGHYPRKLPDYLWEAPLWHHLLHLTWITLLGYTVFSSCNDMILAYWLVRKNLRKQPPG